MKKVLVIIATLSLLPACRQAAVTSRRTLNLKDQPALQQSQPMTTPQVTIWIHGTRGFKPLDEYVHAAPPTSELHSIASLSSNYNRFKNLTKSIAEADPIKFPFEHFYIFGWSGDLSFQERHKAALLLHQDLENLVASYTRTYGHAPCIRIITHSHGGNVALNLATIPHTNKDWFINELILLACPVQHKTEHLIASPLFGKVYSFYSTLDSIQVADPQGLYKKERQPNDKGIFSQRRFPDHEKLIQVKIRVNKHGIPHTGFTLCSFTKNLPAMINYLDAWEQEEPHTVNEVRQLNLIV